MYPNRDEEYDRMRHLALSVILDYNITIDDYPLDMDKLCKRMGINVVPYSAYAENSKLELLLKRSKDGFNVPGNTTQKATIYYNDKYGDYLTPARIAQTKGHELKHILEVFVHEDEEDNPEDLKILAENRAREHAKNLIKMMYHPKAMRKEAGTGVREGKPNVGPL